MSDDQKKNIGRPPHQASETTRRQVFELTELAMSQRHIAKFMRISVETLRKHYKEELINGNHDLHTYCLTKLRTHIDKGNLQALITLMNAKFGLNLQAQEDDDKKEAPKVLVVPKLEEDREKWSQQAQKG